MGQKADLDRVLRERARQLGVPLEEVYRHSPAVPRFLTEAPQIKAPFTSSTEQEATKREASFSTPYPTPECFEPHEIELYIEGKLDPLRIKHLDFCIACSALAATCRPSKPRIKKFEGAVRNLASVSSEKRKKAVAEAISRLEHVESK